MVPPNKIVAKSYRIESHAGSGGMGVVYKARDLRSGRPVAVKEMRGFGGADESHRRRFLREAALLASLRHPRVVRYIDHGISDDGNPFLVTEWLEGCDLTAHLKRNGKLAIEDAVSLAIAIADGLAAVHGHDCLHRDLKPGNIYLIDGDVSEVKLLDFGLATAEHATRMTEPGAIFGTPAYMAPEIARSVPGAGGRAADLYSLGVVLFECLTGRLPFVADNPIALMAKVAVQAAPKASSLRKEIPSALDRLVARLLDKNPTERPDCATEIAAELRALLPGRARGSERRARAARASQVFSTEELRARSIVLLSLEELICGEDDTLAVDTLETDQEILSLLSAHSTRCVQLNASSYIAVARDQDGVEAPLVAARCALQLRELFPRARFAIATGYAAESQTLPAGKPIEEAFLALDAADAGDIRLDDSTVRMLERRFEVVDGCLRRERLTPRRLRVRGTEVPFVGRKRELNTLCSLIDAASEEERLAATLVVAEAGAGKSRLRAELLARTLARKDSDRVWTLWGDQIGGSQPLHGARSLLAAALSHSQTGCSGTRTEQLRAYADELFGDRAGEITPRLEQLLGIASTPTTSTPEDVSASLRAAWLDWMRAELERGPLYLFVDDLQWLDGATVELLTESVRVLADYPWALLAFSRPEGPRRFPALCERSITDVIRLSPLSRRACKAIVRDVHDEVDEELLGRLVDGCEGNPFFLEELLRASADGELSGIPDSVLTMVAHRVERLGQSARQLLRAASIFGEVFWPAACKPLITGDLAEALAELEREELIFRHRDTRFSGADEYQFGHQLMQSAAYAGLTGEDAERGHLAAAEWYASRDADSATLAFHYRRAGDLEKAGPHYARAASAALAANDLAAAFGYAHEAEECGASAEQLDMAQFAPARTLN